MSSDPDPTLAARESGDIDAPHHGSWSRRLRSVGRRLVYGRTPLVVAVALVALILGAVLGYAASGPRRAELDELESEKASALDTSESLREEIADMEDQAAALQAQIDQIDEREAELDLRASALDAREQDLADLKAELEEREQDIAETEKTIEANTIPGDGIWVIGDEVQPGIYKAQGSGSGCYWARLGSIDTLDILSNHFGSASVSVEIHGSDAAFETSGCGTWIRR